MPGVVTPIAQEGSQRKFLSCLYEVLPCPRQRATSDHIPAPFQTSVLSTIRFRATQKGSWLGTDVVHTQPDCAHSRAGEQLDQAYEWQLGRRGMVSRHPAGKRPVRDDHQRRLESRHHQFEHDTELSTVVECQLDCHFITDEFVEFTAAELHGCADAFDRQLTHDCEQFRSDHAGLRASA